MQTPPAAAASVSLRASSGVLGHGDVLTQVHVRVDDARQDGQPAHGDILGDVGPGAGRAQRGDRAVADEHVDLGEVVDARQQDPAAAEAQVIALTHAVASTSSGVA